MTSLDAISRNPFDRHPIAEGFSGTKERWLLSRTVPQGTVMSIVMVAHQTESMDLPICLLTRFSEGFDEVVALHVVKEDVVPLIAAAHHVIDGTGIFDSHFPGHECSLRPDAAKSTQIAEFSTV